MSRVFITGDKHGKYDTIRNFCLKWNTSKEDLLIVLGDNGINYFNNSRDTKLKHKLESLPITFFMIKGNHDMRPDPQTYDLVEAEHDLVRGKVLVEKEFPSLLFSTMYGSYQFNLFDQWINAYVIGGAYSVDKWYRLEMTKRGIYGYNWFADEQLSKEEMDAVETEIPLNTQIVLSHTCPYQYIPRDMFLPQIDQSTVDDTMEHWLDTINEKVNYDKWYCGHWHTDRTVDNLRFMYNDIITLE